jgi:hypothetical protein
VPGTVSILNYKGASATSDRDRDGYMIVQEKEYIFFDGYICIGSILLHFCVFGISLKCIYSMLKDKIKAINLHPRSLINVIICTIQLFLLTI